MTVKDERTSRFDRHPPGRRDAPFRHREARTLAGFALPGQLPAHLISKLAKPIRDCNDDLHSEAKEAEARAGSGLV
jgi:hypothetical protein